MSNNPRGKKQAQNSGDKRKYSPGHYNLDDDSIHGSLYLVYWREFINAGQPIYKIGRTRALTNQRADQYPKQSRLLFQMACYDDLRGELFAHHIFRRRFIHENLMHTELYRGDVVAMIETLFAICSYMNKLHSGLRGLVIGPPTLPEVQAVMDAIPEELMNTTPTNPQPADKPTIRPAKASTVIDLTQDTDTDMDMDVDTDTDVMECLSTAPTEHVPAPTEHVPVLAVFADVSKFLAELFAGATMLYKAPYKLVATEFSELGKGSAVLTHNDMWRCYTKWMRDNAKKIGMDYTEEAFTSDYQQLLGVPSRNNYHLASVCSIMNNDMRGPGVYFGDLTEAVTSLLQNADSTCLYAIVKFARPKGELSQIARGILEQNKPPLLYEQRSNLITSPTHTPVRDGLTQLEARVLDVKPMGDFSTGQLQDAWKLFKDMVGFNENKMIYRDYITNSVEEVYNWYLNMNPENIVDPDQIVPLMIGVVSKSLVRAEPDTGTLTLGGDNTKFILKPNGQLLFFIQELFLGNINTLYAWGVVSAFSQLHVGTAVIDIPIKTIQDLYTLWFYNQYGVTFQSPHYNPLITAEQFVYALAEHAGKRKYIRQDGYVSISDFQAAARVFFTEVLQDPAKYTAICDAVGVVY